MNCCSHFPESQSDKHNSKYISATAPKFIINFCQTSDSSEDDKQYEYGIISND